MKSFYVGTKLIRRDVAQEAARGLIKIGFRQTFDWTAVPDLRQRPLGDAERGAAALAEIEGVQKADFVVILLPGGRGTHAELGAALALGKRIYLHAFDKETFTGDEYVCAFYEHPLVSVVVGDLVKLLLVVRAGEGRLGMGVVPSIP